MDERPEEEDERPWEQPGGVRRDCLPHRVELLQLLENIAKSCCLLSACLFVSALISLTVGIAVWVMASQDLARMRAGMMDPEGEKATVNVRETAITLTMLSIFFPLLCGIPAWFCLLHR
jgi:hypothetical protein